MFKGRKKHKINTSLTPLFLQKAANSVRHYDKRNRIFTSRVCLLCVDIKFITYDFENLGIKQVLAAHLLLLAEIVKCLRVSPCIYRSDKLLPAFTLNWISKENLIQSQRITHKINCNCHVIFNRFLSVFILQLITPSLAMIKINTVFKPCSSWPITKVCKHL